MIWVLDLTCCGRDNGRITALSYEEAEERRESYLSGPSIDPHGYSGDGFSGHQRSAVLSRLTVTSAPDA